MKRSFGRLSQNRLCRLSAVTDRALAEEDAVAEKGEAGPAVHLLPDLPGPWSLVLAPSVRPLWVREGECGAAACPLRSSIDAVGSAVLLRRRACQRANKLRARSDAEFAVSVGQVVLDRLRGKEQLRGRLGVGRAVPDNEGDLQLLSG